MSPPETAPGARPVRVGIADDHDVVRAGLRAVLETESDLVVVAEAVDVDGAARMVLGHKPDVLVLDVSMPGGSSLKAIRRMLSASPSTVVVVLTMHADPALAEEALREGARAYVLKETAGTELVRAIRAALDGHTYLQPSLGAALATAARRGPADDGLTAREKEVLRLVALGHTNTEIGHQLCLSVRTVESHRAHIQQKLRRSGRPELVAYALERGIVGRPPSRA